MKDKGIKAVSVQPLDKETETRQIGISVSSIGHCNENSIEDVAGGVPNELAEPKQPPPEQPCEHQEQSLPSRLLAQPPPVRGNLFLYFGALSPVVLSLVHL